ncbi:PsiF family protein [Methylobacterium phyllostachyos]|uniref:PsiF family protein n=1 Tax=Methylobacterium phyllostachyos TaxID=582672 RepID=UPI003CC7A116
MRRSLALVAALVSVAYLPAAGHAQSTAERPRQPASGTTATGEGAASAIDPAVLDRCRQQADTQKLKNGPERKAFMGTCVTPED